MAVSQTTTPSSAALRAAFDEVSPLTVGLEEEVALLDAQTLDLAPRGAELLAAAGEDAPFKLEMPATQVEIAGAPAATVEEAVAGLAAGRRRLAALAAEHGLRPACMAVHPFAAAEAPLNDAARYAAIEAAYGTAARRQLVSALHVHVRVAGADRALAVYNALRHHLPDVAALAACAPYYEGGDTGLASVRPLICTLLPRQGIPPALPSWDAFAAALADVGDPAAWWWELRPHRLHGTLEVRAPDVQASLGQAAAVGSFVHALVGWLAARHDAGEAPPDEEAWRIDERRWSALRHGAGGPVGERVAALIDDLEAWGAELGDARALLAGGGQAARLRVACGGDVREATERLAGRFLEGIEG
jgi:carboxylate-amine ligase